MMETIWTELMGHEFSQSFYNARAVRTRCIEAGRGEPLILLHGTGGHAEAYVRNIAAHAKHFHVYALDMVGHGYSDAPDLNYDIDDFTNFLADFVDAIGANKVCVSGESLGAMVASWYAIRNPDRVAKLVMNTGILVPPNETGRMELADALERSRAATGQLTREAVRKRLDWLMYEPDKSVTDELVEVRYKIYSQPGRAAVMRKIAERVLGDIISPGFNKWANPEKLREVKCPTLVLWTNHNPGQPLEVAREGMKYLSKAKLVVLEKSAHWPQWEEAQEFNRAHLAFLLGA
jgi:2-hydroxy-6-oxonona-2,4-dienedioate hydrolase